MELAEQTGLSRLIGEHVDLPSTRVASGAVNPAGKLTTIIAGMMCGADSIDDVNVLRAGGTPRVFGEVYAPSTLGIFLREFTFGHANQLAAVAREHLAALARRTPCCPASSSARSWTSTRCCARSMGTKAGRLVRARQDCRAGAAAQGTVATGDDVVHGAGGAGDRRGVAARRQDRLRARRRPAGEAGRRHRPRGRVEREDHASRRFRVRHQEGDRPPASTSRSSSR